jgi:hypothetical protein
MTEYEFFTALKSRYNSREYALLPQVRNATGYARKTRTADALAISLWPSRGIDVHGFEFKDSRADWLKELKEPEKSEEIGRFCSFWWLAVSDREIIKKDELPKGWGLVLVNGEVKTVQQAPRREAMEPSWAFMASVLRTASEVVIDEKDVEARINAEVQKRVREIDKANAESSKKENERHEAEYRKLHNAIQEFENASGVGLSRYQGQNQRIGEAVRFVLAGGLKGELERIAEVLPTLAYAQRGLEELKRIAEEISGAAS